MGARTGTEFTAGLRDNREVWLGNERVEDVTTHPAFRAAVESIAHLYDMQHDPAYRDTLCYPSPTSGNPVGLSFLIPRTRDDLVRRRAMSKVWADATCGMMGRSADFLNAMLTAWAAKADYFARQSPECRERVLDYYEYCRENDLFLTHTLVDPQVDRSRNRAEQDDPHQCLGIVDETAEGLVIRGAKMIATAAPFADEILAWPFPPTLTAAESAYAIVFIIPVASPGLKILCRESFTRPGPVEDHPLSARFDEMDAVAVFDDVLVPGRAFFCTKMSIWSARCTLAPAFENGRPTRPIRGCCRRSSLSTARSASWLKPSGSRTNPSYKRHWAKRPATLKSLNPFSLQRNKKPKLTLPTGRSTLPSRPCKSDGSGGRVSIRA